MKKNVLAMVLMVLLTMGAWATHDQEQEDYKPRVEKKKCCHKHKDCRSNCGDEHEVLLKRKGRSGFYGGPVLKITKVDGEFGALSGGKLGWVFNGSLGIGVAGYGWVHGDFYDDCWYDCDHYDDAPEMSYGGVFIEGILSPNKVVHMSFGILLGGGVINKDIWGYGWWDEGTFMVVEPEVNIEINLTRYMRLTGGVSYRWAGSLDDHHYYKDDRLSGVACTLGIKFGAL